MTDYKHKYAVTEHRRRQKEALVYAFGNKCRICHCHIPAKCFQFHHLNPDEKSFNFSSGNTRASNKLIEEAKKCIMVCPTCHELITHSYLNISFRNMQSSFDEIKYKTRLKQLNFKEPKTKKKVTTKNSINYPNRDSFKKLIRNNSFTKAGDILHCTASAIRKHCIREKLPYRKTEIDKMSDEKWNNC